MPGKSSGLPASWSHAWKQASPHSFVLESGKDGRYTYLAGTRVGIAGEGRRSARNLPSGRQHGMFGSISA
ncbi:hypothetical protein VQ056_08310 [Paenibacillus sp. JTLBN-2024]